MQIANSCSRAFLQHLTTSALQLFHTPDDAHHRTATPKQRFLLPSWFAHPVAKASCQVRAVTCNARLPCAITSPRPQKRVGR